MKATVNCLPSIFLSLCCSPPPPSLSLCRKNYSFSVFASESGSVAPSLTGTATVFIEVIDVNDNEPDFIQNNFQFEIFENMPSGTVVGNVSATDLDAGTNAQVFSLSAMYLTLIACRNQ